MVRKEEALAARPGLPTGPARAGSSSLVDQLSRSWCRSRADLCGSTIIAVAVVRSVGDLALRLACRQHRCRRRRCAYAGYAHRFLIGDVDRPGAHARSKARIVC